ncbi:MAG: DUF4185 domain-containing protein [Planctomycetes bacterium]|nr:DUF4185 domain-containing protein [Planctomycetota bacterium]
MAALAFLLAFGFVAPLPRLRAFGAPQGTEPASDRGAPPSFQLDSTTYVGRLTTGCERVGLAGTDLGVSFEAGGRLVFLFGDSWTLDRKDWDADSVAFARLGPLGDEGPAPLTWLTRDGKRFFPLAPKSMQLGGMNVPVEGFAVGDRTYVFFDGGWDAQRGVHSHSILAHTRKLEFAELELDHSVASAKFLNVSVARDGADLWIFGTGTYRKSAIYLARVPVSEVGNRAKWRYWPALDAPGKEEDAQPIVATNSAGELSVRRVGADGPWFLAYNSADPRGIVLHAARDPRGPWSAPLVIFDPERDRGYGYFLHRKTSAAGFDDGLSEPGREEDFGGEYGPYLVPRWSSETEAGVELVYTLSSWNPYQVHVLRTRLTRPGGAWTAPRVRTPSAGSSLANADFATGTLERWTAEGDAFALARRPDGAWELTTYVKPLGDAVRGRLHQEFTVPRDARLLRGFVKGGTESVRLMRGDEVLRETRGPRTNDRELELRWMLEPYRGERLRLEVRDDSTDRWGFVTVRGLALES